MPQRPDTEGSGASVPVVPGPDATSPWVLDSELDAALLELPDVAQIESDITDLQGNVSVLSEAPLNIDQAADGDLSTAIDTVNAAPAADEYAIYVPSAEDRSLVSAPSTITKDNLTIFGDGISSTLEHATDKGTFFTVDAERFAVRNLELSCTGVTAPESEPAIVLQTASDATIQNVRFVDVSSVLKTGTTGLCSRVRMESCRGTVLTSSGAHWFHLKDASGSRFLGNQINSSTPTLANTLINGSVSSNAATYTVDATTDFPTSGAFWCNGVRVPYTGKTGTTFTGCTGAAGTTIPDNAMVYEDDQSAYFFIDGSTTGSDTLYVENNTFFTQPGASGLVGKPFGLRIDATGDSVNNLWFVNNTIDGTHLAEVYYRGDSNVDTVRGLHIEGNRMETANGRVLDFSHATGGSNVAQAIFFSRNYCFYGNDDYDTQTPFKIAGSTKVSQFNLNHNIVSETTSTATRNEVIDISADDWQVIGNNVRKQSAGASLDVNYVLTTSNGVAKCIFDDNSCGNVNTAPINHFAYTTPTAGRRFTKQNLPALGAPTKAAAGTLVLPEGDYDMVRITGNTNITAITPTFADHRVTLKFSGTPTVSASATIKLSGAANFVATADDTLTLVCDGSTWYQVGSSVNA